MTPDAEIPEHILHLHSVVSEAKTWCIEQITHYLGQDALIPGLSSTDQSTLTVQQWLVLLQPNSVVGLFLEFRDQIPARNSYLTTTNPILHNATGSSTNAVLLGNTLQSRGSLFYIAPYICKNKVVVTKSLLAIEKAMNHVDKEPYTSKADDRGTNKRYVQHMLTRAVNDLSKSIQLSDTQMALSLLNTGTEITSDSYKYFRADSSLNYFLYHWSNEEYKPPEIETELTHPDMWQPNSPAEEINEETELHFNDILETSHTGIQNATPSTSKQVVHDSPYTPNAAIISEICNPAGPMEFGPAPLYS
jgi:hypothetical protein